MPWVILSISIKILIWPHMLSLRPCASRPVLICMSGLDNVWGPFQSEKKPLILLYKWDHIPPTKNWGFFFFNNCTYEVWMQHSGMEAIHAHLPDHKDGGFLHDELTCPRFPCWPQRNALSCEPLQMQVKRQIIGSAGILSFLIWIAIQSQCESKTTNSAIMLIWNMQKLKNSTRQRSSHIFPSLTNIKKTLSSFLANFVVL